ncbi:secreted protein containing FecR protein domain protein [Rhodopirellula maiorica SM1]|uniref:Secreted protein containing FecR protein domain protein n=2 Tax=Novipirellula TaxID=2795426 RepID=M5RAZ4_9BACT|nr:secreted protein containing FecR protein domain protein [Rhodopirellula maiorica SM1]
MMLMAGTLLAIAACLFVLVPLIPGINAQQDVVAWDPSAATNSQRVSRPQIEPSASGFAILSGQSEAVWEGATVGIDSGGLLPEGELHLKSGLVHLELFSGVQVVVEGEAVFSIDSPMQISMTRGRARAQVPNAAHGFRIKTAAGEVVDLGTEFAIDVTDDRSSVQVVDGEVELRPQGTGTGTDSLRLFEGESMDLMSDGQVSQTQTADLNLVGPVAFQRELAQSQLNRLQRWQAANERMRTDPRLIAHYQVDPNADWSRQLVNLAAGRDDVASDGAVVAAERAVDRWGRNGGALDFSRTGSRVRLDVPGTHRGLTLFCWVKINSLDRWYNSLFLTDGHEDREPHWQIMDDGRMFFSVKVPTTNSSKPQKVAHKIYYSEPIWNTSLSGRWIMLATVYDVDSQHVSHYVNGTEISSEAIPAESLAETIEIGAASICNWSQPMYRTDATFVVRNLNGVMDEFAMFSGALSQQEIKEIYKVGDPY